MVNSSSTITNAKLWSVKSPSLYTVTVDVMDGSGKLLDSTNYSVGVRTLVYSNKGLSLNQEPVKVRGFCDHSNFAGVGGAVPDRVNLYRVQMLRSVGGNAVPSWGVQTTLTFSTANRFCIALLYGFGRRLQAAAFGPGSGAWHTTRPPRRDWTSWTGSACWRSTRTATTATSA